MPTQSFIVYGKNGGRSIFQYSAEEDLSLILQHVVLRSLSNRFNLFQDIFNPDIFQ